MINDDDIRCINYKILNKINLYIKHSTNMRLCISLLKFYSTDEYRYFKIHLKLSEFNFNKFYLYKVKNYFIDFTEYNKIDIFIFSKMSSIRFESVKFSGRIDEIIRGIKPMFDFNVKCNDYNIRSTDKIHFIKNFTK